MADYIDTYYLDTLATTQRFPVLTKAVDVDCCVIGGGLAGLTAAYEMQMAGKKVALLEANRIGWGASGRNGGFVSPGFAAGNKLIEKAAGAANARALHAMSIEGMTYVRNQIDRLKISDAKPVHGIMWLRRYEADEGEMRRGIADLAKNFDYEISYLDKAAIAEHVNSTAYRCGTRDTNAFHFHPLNYLRALAAAFAARGGLIFEETRATRIERNKGNKYVHVANGSVCARDILVATGGYTDGLLPELDRAFLPIATYVLVSKKCPNLLANAIMTSDAIGDDRRAGDYYRLVDDGQRLLWGGRITTRKSDPRNIAGNLMRSVVGTYPQLAGLEIEHSWSGLMSYARHLMPQIGMVDPNVWYCTGFGGHGMNTTAIGGKVIAEAILGKSDRHRLFAPFDLAWTGGIFGQAAVQATYWWLQANDWWRER